MYRFHDSPDVRGLDVLDAGCGTGRWLEKLVGRSPRSLLGVDISPAMLLFAGIKLKPKLESSPRELHGSAGQRHRVRPGVVFLRRQLPGRSGSFAREIDRVARPGATIFLTDMHPETEAFRGWKRAFKVKGAETQIEPGDGSPADHPGFSSSWIQACFAR